MAEITEIPFKVCIVGSGICGLLAAAFLPDSVLGSSCIIDPTFFGGDLMEKWCCVKSNTTVRQITDALDKVPRFKHLLIPYLHEYPAGDIVSLRIIAQAIKDLAGPIINQMKREVATVQEITNKEGKIEILLDSGRMILAEKVILCTGVQPRVLAYDVPCIPLEIALDNSRLERYVKKGQCVMVFGLSHSGTLVIANLAKMCSRVYGVYKGAKPFLFARDDEYDGIKQEAAVIADSVLAGGMPSCTLLSLTESEKDVKRIMRYCDYVVYCVGFKQKGLSIKNGDINIDLSAYNSVTAQLADVPIWCYGAGFPNKTDYKGKTHYDVGIPSFVDYMLRTFPALI
jgi:hypothetical protein